jgi:hypothetical protein
MTPLSAREIRGSWATLLLPIQPDDSIDFGLIGGLIARDGFSPMAADKAAAVAGGWLPGLTTRLRWPYRWVDSRKARSYTFHPLRARISM